MKKLLCLLIIAVTGCTTIEKNTKPTKVFEKNFKMSVVNNEIVDPANDRRCFYRVYIDKQPAGRTTTGLESQMKTFETNLEANNHLVRIEKWVLDEEQRKYVKLNNIEQPKPNYIYITVEEGKQTSILVKSGKYGKSSFTRHVSE